MATIYQKTPQEIQKTKYSATLTDPERKALAIVRKLDDDAWRNNRVRGILDAARRALHYGKTLNSPQLRYEAWILAKEYIEKAKPTDFERLCIAHEFDLGGNKISKYSEKLSPWARYYIEDTYPLVDKTSKYSKRVSP